MNGGFHSHGGTLSSHQWLAVSLQTKPSISWGFPCDRIVSLVSSASWPRQENHHGKSWIFFGIPGSDGLEVRIPGIFLFGLFFSGQIGSGGKNTPNFDWAKKHGYGTPGSLHDLGSGNAQWSYGFYGGTGEWYSGAWPFWWDFWGTNTCWILIDHGFYGDEETHWKWLGYWKSLNFTNKNNIMGL